MLSVANAHLMLSVVMLNVVMHNVVAPTCHLTEYSQNFLKYVLTKVLAIVIFKFKNNFFLKFSKKIFKIIYSS